MFTTYKAQHFTKYNLSKLCSKKRKENVKLQRYHRPYHKKVLLQLSVNIIFNNKQLLVLHLYSALLHYCLQSYMYKIENKFGLEPDHFILYTITI